MVPAVLAALIGCHPHADSGPADTELPGDTDPVDTDRVDTDGTTDDCACRPGPHNDLVYVLSDDSQIWSFDPATLGFTHVVDVGCVDRPFSMAVDRTGHAWMLSATTHDLQTVDLVEPGACTDPGFTPNQADFPLFGMAYAADGPNDACATLFVHRYSGSGPFAEGDGIGKIGRIDRATLAVSELATTDWNGGELAGTADGRLFGFVGADPSRLVEFDETTGAVLSSRDFDFPKTQASAFAFYRGTIYLFTEAEPAGCDACLAASCPTAADDCRADPTCNADFECVLSVGDFSDDCGGSLPNEFSSCIQGCATECLPQPEDRVSRVRAIDVRTPDQPVVDVVLQAPIRIVGAGTSTCVPLEP
jgi:hypothetical protein